MAKYIKGEQRGQQVLFPVSIEDLIEEENEARLIDMFVEKIDLKGLKITKSEPNAKGTNHYDPRDILKLYIYGYRNGIRSSRKLEKLCKTNIEVMWLMRNIKPDFRTINEFRKENVKQLKEVFKELIMVCNKLNLTSGKVSEDGVKIRAVNSKEKNYTLNKLDDRIKRIEEKIDKYLKEMDEEDKREAQERKETNLPDKEELGKRIEKYKEEKKKLEEYEKEIEKRKESQISITDKDSKLMKNNGKYEVCYNNQVVVDEESHIVVNYEANNNPADCGQLERLSKETKENVGREVIVNTTDKGYNSREDMAKCLEEGIIPQVTLMEGKEEHEIEIEYEEEENQKEGKTREEEIRNELRRGKVPKEYEGYVELKEIKEKIIMETEEEAKTEEISEEELRDYAIKNKCFMKSKTGKVYCPEGEILRAKSKNGEGKKYCNKLACKNCKNPCTEAKFKEVVMREGQIISTNNKELRRKFKTKGKRKKKIVKVVVYKIKPKEEHIRKRMGTSEHVHGTMKIIDNFSYFLLKGKEKVNGELALYYCASNLRRIGNIMGIREAIGKIEDAIRVINIERSIKTT